MIHTYAPIENDQPGELSYPIDSRMVEDGFLKRIRTKASPLSRATWDISRILTLTW